MLFSWNIRQGLKQNHGFFLIAKSLQVQNKKMKNIEPSSFKIEKIVNQKHSIFHKKQKFFSWSILYVFLHKSPISPFPVINIDHIILSVWIQIYQMHQTQYSFDS